MALQTSVVGEDFARGEKERGTAEWLILWIVREEDRGQADSVAAKFLFYGRSFFERNFEMPSRGLEAPDLGAHRVGQRGVSATKADDHCLGIFSESAEEAGFEGLEQSYLNDTRKIATPIRGVKARAMQTAEKPKRSTTPPMAGERKACIKP